MNQKVKAIKKPYSLKILYCTFILMIICVSLISEDEGIKIKAVEIQNVPEAIEYSNNHLDNGVLFFEGNGDKIWILELKEDNPSLSVACNLSNIIDFKSRKILKSPWMHMMNVGPVNGPWAITIEGEERDEFDFIVSREICTLKYDAVSGFSANIQKAKAKTKDIENIIHSSHVGENTSFILAMGVADKKSDPTYNLLSFDESTGKTKVISYKAMSMFDTDYELGKVYCVLGDNLVEIDINDLTIRKLHPIVLTEKDPFPYQCSVIYFPETKMVLISDFTKIKNPVTYTYDITNDKVSTIGDWIGMSKIDSLGMPIKKYDEKECKILNKNGILQDWPSKLREKLSDKYVLAYFKTGENEFTMVYQLKK